MISAIILAAGMSSRMGFPKQLLKLGNKPLIRIVTENVLASAVDEIVVVTGCRSDEVTAAIRDLPVKNVFNPNYEQGQGSSLAAGIKAINLSTTAFLVFMCDQPLISPYIINMVIREFKERNCLALRPICRDIPGHPVMISYTLSNEFKGLKEDDGARQVLKRLGNKVEYLSVQDETVILDIDTPQSYRRLQLLAQSYIMEAEQR